MKRREFSKLTSLGAIAITTSGFVHFNGESYVGDCQTTSDILGPFYRPDSPVRNNLVIEGTEGPIVELSGVVRHKDCKTPYKNAKVELWHCDAQQVYDNHTDEYRYRGCTYCDEQGNYKFTTQMPVPYPVGDGTIRPAHFHLMVSAAGYQSLITQIYFTGDPHLEEDSSSASPLAKERILEVKSEAGKKAVVFDCNMNDRLKVSYSSLQQIVGKYKDDKGKVKEFFAKDGLLWLKNEVFGWSFEYMGENNFQYMGTPEGTYDKLQFRLTEKQITVLRTSRWDTGEERKESWTKI